MLGPDDRLCCAVKAPVGRRRVNAGVAKMERLDGKALGIPSFPNEIQWIALKKNNNEKQPRTLVKQTGQELVRAARCEACSSTEIEAIKVHVGHCHNCPVKTFVHFWRHTHGGEPIHTRGMIILPRHPPASLRPEVSSLKVGSDAHWDAAEKSVYTDCTSTWQWLLQNLLKTWSSLPDRWDATSSLDKTTVERSKTISTECCFCSSFNLLDQ